MAPSLEVVSLPKLNGDTHPSEKIPAVVDIAEKSAIFDTQQPKSVAYPRLQPEFEIEDHPIDIVRKLRVGKTQSCWRQNPDRV